MMRRVLVRIATLLVLGAVITVALAWACAWWLPVSTQFDLSGSCGIYAGYGFGAEDLYVIRRDRLGVTRVECNYHIGTYVDGHWASRDALPNWAARQIVVGVDSFQQFFATGWPARAMECHLEGNLGIGSAPGHELIGGLRLPVRPVPPAGYTHVPALPYRPIWPGLAIDTLFYAAILWLLFFAPGTARRLYRARRRCCTRCGYPVGTSPTCTECGQPLTT